MRKLITIALLLCSMGVMGQTNQPLPPGSVPLSNILYLAPDSTVWTGDEFNGLFVKVAKWNSVDSALSWHVSSSKPTKPGYRFTVIPDTDGDSDVIGVTGLSYREDTEEYVVSYYSYAKESKLWFYNRNSPNLTPYSPTGPLTPTPDRELDLTAYIDHIQGNVWDADSACYWVLGTEKGSLPSDNTRVLIAVDTNGSLISTTPLNGIIVAQMGQIARKGSVLMIKPNNTTTLFFMDRHTKEIIRTAETHTQYEGLAYDPNRDLIWIAGDEGKIAAYDYESFNKLGEFGFATLPDGSDQNVEGMLIDPVDDKLLIGFDGYLHGGNQNGNAIFKFDFPRYVSPWQNTVRLVTSNPLGSSSSVLSIRNSNDSLGNNLFNINSRGQMSGRVYDSSGDLAAGYTIQHGESPGESATIRFADFNPTTGVLIGDNTLAAKKNMMGFYMKSVDRSTSPVTQNRFFDFDFKSGNVLALSSNIDSIDAYGKAYITKDWATAKAGLLHRDQEWTGSNVFSPSESSATPPPGSFQIGYANAGSGTGTYIRAFNPGNTMSFLIRGYNHTTGVQAVFFQGGVDAAGAYTNTSDSTIKNIITHDWSAVGNLSAKAFTYKDGRDGGRVHVGYIAQEVSEYLPDAVYKSEETGLLSVDHVQVLIAKVALLEKRLAELEAKLEEQ